MKGETTYILLHDFSSLLFIPFIFYPLVWRLLFKENKIYNTKIRIITLKRSFFYIKKLAKILNVSIGKYVLL